MEDKNFCIWPELLSKKVSAGGAADATSDYSWKKDSSRAAIAFTRYEATRLSAALSMQIAPLIISGTMWKFLLIWEQLKASEVIAC